MIRRALSVTVVPRVMVIRPIARRRGSPGIRSEGLTVMGTQAKLLSEFDVLTMN